MFNGRWLHLSLILSLLLLAAWFRVWRFADLPPGLWYDEAYNGMDSLAMLETGSPQLFFNGNSGREPLFLYLQSLSLKLLGPAPYALRLVSGVVGLLTIALMYRWLLNFFSQEPDRYWLALIGAAGLTFSLWHVSMSRTGYRAVLVPLFVLLISDLFWQAWQKRSWLYFSGAGLALGLSQYTYTSTRLLPLIFVIFAATWFLFARQTSISNRVVAGSSFEWFALPARRLQTGSDLQVLALGLLSIALVSLLVFLPLGLFFLQNPTFFFGRTVHVSILNQMAQVEISPATFLLNHLIETLQVFVDGSGDPNWRHTVVDRANFDGLTRVGFWLGLIVALVCIRRPRYLWLLVSLLVLWLPAFLSDINTLRLAGFMVPYYALMAIGLVTLVRQAGRFLPGAPLWPRLALFGLVLLVSGGMTGYNYFVRWANEPEVYLAFRGQLVDLTHHLLEKSKNNDILLPFQTYTHPTTRFLLHSQFKEINRAPAPLPNRPALLVIVRDMVDPPSKVTAHTYVWLTRDTAGQGLAYLLPPSQLVDLAALDPAGEAVPFHNPRTGRRFAELIPLKITTALAGLMDQPAIAQVNYNWDQQLVLAGYEVRPDRLLPGQSPLLTLYWQSLVWQPFNYTIFVQLVDGRGTPLGQWTDGFFSDQHRWRIGHMIPTQHRLWLGPDVPPGPYLVRMGLFDFKTGQRAPINTAGGESIGDQIILGLFYVSEGERDPRQPQHLLTSTLGHLEGDQIQLLGYSLPGFPANQETLRVRLYWQAGQRLRQNYTIFVQLLDAQDQLVTSWDAQPLAGQYPTSLWQPGEIVVDEFTLPLSGELPPGNYRLVTGMYDFSTGQRLPATGADGQRWPDDMILLYQAHLP